MRVFAHLLFSVLLISTCFGNKQSGPDAVMEQKYLTLDNGFRLTYYESSDSNNDVSKPNLLLVHGNSASGLTFEAQVMAAAAGRGTLIAHETNRIIAIDLPGHGDSDRFPSASDYSLPSYADTIVQAAEALGILPNAVLCGWSLGGHILLEAATALEERGVKGIAIYGTPPLAFPPDFATAFLPNPAVGVGFLSDVTQEQAELYASSFFAPGTDVPSNSTFVTDILRTDGNARAGLATSIFTDEIIIVEQTLTKPFNLAILHGESEQLANLTYIEELDIPTLWRKRVVTIADSGHAPHFENVRRFNKLIGKFARSSQRSKKRSN